MIQSQPLENLIVFLHRQNPLPVVTLEPTPPSPRAIVLWSAKRPSQLWENVCVGIITQRGPALKVRHALIQKRVRAASLKVEQSTLTPVISNTTALARTAPIAMKNTPNININKVHGN